MTVRAAAGVHATEAARLKLSADALFRFCQAARTLAKPVATRDTTTMRNALPHLAELRDRARAGSPTGPVSPGDQARALAW